MILIESGNYTEQVCPLLHLLPLFLVLSQNLTSTDQHQVNVTRRGPTYLLGQTAHPKNQSYNTVNIIWAAIAVTGLDNAFTSTLTVAPNLNASLTGSGPTGFAVPADTPFGCVDFRTYNLNFINDFAPYSDDPSLALSISYANGGFYYTGFYSYQDTVCTLPLFSLLKLTDVDLRRQTRQRLLQERRSSRRDGFLLWFRYRLGRVHLNRTPQLRWWNHCLEGD